MARDIELSAQGRLAVLSAHLTAAFIEAEDSSTLQPHCLSAQTVVLPPPNLQGTLTVIDDRTGKKYQVQVSEGGTVQATDLKKVFFLVSFCCSISVWLVINCKKKMKVKFITSFGFSLIRIKLNSNSKIRACEFLSDNDWKT